VITALGFGAERAHSSLRFGLGRSNDAEQVAYAVEAVTQRVKVLRALMYLSYFVSSVLLWYASYRIRCVSIYC
jgi:hypothetical protein